MKIGRGNRSTRRKPVPAPLCPPQIPLDQTRGRTRAAAVGSQRLTAELWRGHNSHVNEFQRNCLWYVCCEYGPVDMDFVCRFHLEHSLRQALNVTRREVRSQNIRGLKYYIVLFSQK
jgi:hypothetical protein